MSSDLQNPIFTDEAKAREALEAVRWPNGAVCPHCGATENIARIETVSARPGLLYCNDCKGQFTVTVGTVFERSKVPLTKWWLASYLISSSKKGMSSLQLSRMLGVTYKTAWFMTHRIREAMIATAGTPPIGGANKVVEVDETYVGGKEKNRHANKKHRAGRGAVTKQPVVSLVERGGTVRSFHLPQVTAKTLKPILKAHISKRSYVMTDEAKVYPAAVGNFNHGSVNHSAGEYVRGTFWHTNTVENYFSILKRGIVGTFHHVSQQHLSRYVTEFDFRYNNRNINDAERTITALRGIEGKRLTYRRVDA